MRSSVVPMYLRSNKIFHGSFFPLHFAAMECQWPGWLTTRPAVAVDECLGNVGGTVADEMDRAADALPEPGAGQRARYGSCCGSASSSSGR